MKILIAYDGSKYSNMILKNMLRAGLPSEAEVLVLTVIHPDEPAQAAMNEAANDAVAVIRQSFPQWSVIAQTLFGLPAPEILRRAQDWRPGLIIAGTHGRSPLRRVFLGSVALALMRGSECSIRIVRSGFPDRKEPIRLVVGHDGSPQAKAVIREVARRHWPQGTQAVVVSAVDLDNLDDEEAVAESPATGPAARTRQRLQRVVKESVDELTVAGIVAHGTVVEGDPCRILFEEADRLTAETIFVGVRGLSRLGGLLLGSVSDRVVRQAHCSVEIVRENS